MKYYAAVDEDGVRFVYKNCPVRYQDEWIDGGEGTLVDGKYTKNFPDITWNDEPVQVGILLEVVK